MKRAVLLLVLLGACRSRGPFTQSLALGGGKSVAPEVLNDGHEGYMLYCYACHGEKGDGRGPSAPGMRPPPRDFTQGMFKFAGVSAGELPNDDDLVALVRSGLEGTPMLAWDIPERERNAIVQFLKTFSERWKTETPGERVVPDAADPWTGKEAEAIELGERIYHLQGAEMNAAGQPVHIYAGCNACHPSYLAKAELDKLSQRVLKKPAELREDPFRPAAKESEYKIGEHKLPLLPTDFMFHPIKTGTGLESLYRTIGAGIGGTAMPFWKAAINNADMWALAHYVRSVAQKRGTAEAMALQAKLVAE